MRALERRIAELDERIAVEVEVEASGTTLTEIFGVGPILLAAKIVGIVGNNVGRFPSTRRTTSPPRRASPRSRPPAGRCSGTGSGSPGSDTSTRSCT